MAAKKVATVAPTGLTISRNEGVFTFSWKIGDADYGEGQQINYHINGYWHGAFSIDKTITSYSVNAGSVASIGFSVCGRRKNYEKKVKKKTKKYNPSWSAWASAGWSATIPAAPSLSYDRSSANAGKFSWSLSTSDTDTAIFTRVEYQTIAVRNTEDPPGGNWSAGTGGASGNKEYTETLSGSNLVRWFRARSVGPAGQSVWVYSHHAYGNPSTPVLQEASASMYQSVSRITAVWTGYHTLLAPIDTIVVQYVIAAPTDTAFSAPASGWSDAISVAGNGAADKTITNVSALVGEDECMWVRVCAKHDDSETYSVPILAYIGQLATPGLEATPDPSSGNVAITITENTDCTAACTAVFYRSEKRPNYDQIVAVLPRGTTTVTVNIPEIASDYSDPVDTTCFGAWAFVGSYTDLSVSARMRSQVAIDSDILARPPAWLQLSNGSQNNSVRIKWPWTWGSANSAELSWADHEDAWESTDEPSTYKIDNKRVESWVISGLSLGKRWYFRVRLLYESDEENIEGPWSETYAFDLSSIPDRPALMLSKSVINEGGSVTARWGYTSEDGTTQDYADICLATIDVNGVVTYGDIIAHVDAGMSVEIGYAWATGATYYMCVRTTSTSGRQSEWSEPASLYVAQRIQLSVTDISSGFEYDSATGRYILSSLGLDLTATGAGPGGTTTASIVRRGDYHVYRPDGKAFDGYDKEVIALKSVSGESSLHIDIGDLIGPLDDGAPYLLTVTIVDEYGQTASQDFPFIVDWDHKPGVPSATAQVDIWQRIAVITPIAPEGVSQGDVCDIYRISIDQPELIVKDAQYGVPYVDPYPAFGEFCGHRIVAKSAYGDYITDENTLAWFLSDMDIGDLLEENAMIIDVNGEQIELPYNIDLANTWTKDFKRTTYLGGAVQGDWNPAVTRDLSASTVILRGPDIDTMIAMRGLAGYSGAAHIRTPDGSSFACDIQIKESTGYKNEQVTYSLMIEKVDAQQPEGMTLEEWNEMHPIQ